MAVCVIGATMNTETGTVHPACNVHCVWAPCPANGEPASQAPIECADGDPSRDKALRFWTLRTTQQRPGVLPQGSLGDERLHDDERGCWCGPAYFAPVELLSGDTRKGGARCRG